ncbi:MAG: DUF58 domain-containing protein [Chlorobi bacterium]|nr:DUF58 domain-containing protein [Chlorobiota bacterium]
METKELLKKVRQIEIKTRGLSKQIFAGEYHSAFKGRGMSFSEVREYQYGDDVRNIDWNVTARYDKAYIKTYEEERELTVMLLIDISASQNFGTKERFKKDLITEIAAVISFSAIQNNDKVGVIFFTDKIEKFIPPQKGKKHILRIIRELIEFRPENTATDISLALQYFTNIVKKRSTAFLISDFFDTGFEKAVQIAGHKHDLIALHIYDEKEYKLPNIGLIKLQDAETGKEVYVDTSKKSVRSVFEKNREQLYSSVKQIFDKTGIDSVRIKTDEDYIKPLLKLFKNR